MRIDPDIHATPCAVADMGCEIPVLAAARNAVAHARRVVAEYATRDDDPIQSPSTLSHRRRPDPPVTIWHHGDMTRMDVSYGYGHQFRFLIGPRSRLATRMIEPGPSQPDHAAARILDAVDVHTAGLADRRLVPEDVAARLALLEGIEAHVRTSRDLPPDSDRLRHDFGDVEAATPWSPLRARTWTSWEYPGREMLTTAERRVWTGPPVITMATSISKVDGLERLPILWIDALRAPALPQGDPVGDMRRLMALDPAPPGRKLRR